MIPFDVLVIEAIISLVFLGCLFLTEFYLIPWIKERKRKKVKKNE